jgi:hypothetical protein
MKFHVTSFHSGIFVSVNSSTEDREKCLSCISIEPGREKISMTMLKAYATGSHLDINLTKEPVQRNTSAATITTHTERVLLKENLLLKCEGCKPRLGGIEST